MIKKPKARISTFGSRITSVISVALVLLIIGILAMTLQASSKLGDDIRRNIGFIVKVDNEATDADVLRLKRQVQGAPYVESFVYSSAEDILAEESELMGENIDSLLNENPFGAEFDIKVRNEYANSDSIASVASRIEQDEAVSRVVTESSVVDSINSTISRLTVVLLAIAAALLVISFVLINNTVSLAIYSRRFIIHTMKLVGATGAFIRRPFLLAGLATGAVAAVIAMALLAGIRAYAATLDPIVEQALSWEGFGLVAGIMLVSGLLICLLASAIATNRYLRADYDEMFMK